MGNPLKARDPQLLTISEAKGQLMSKSATSQLWQTWVLKGHPSIHREIDALYTKRTHLWIHPGIPLPNFIICGTECVLLCATFSGVLGNSSGRGTVGLFSRKTIFRWIRECVSDREMYYSQMFAWPPEDWHINNWSEAAVIQL